MNTALWIVQLLLAAAFVTAGGLKVFAYGKFKAMSAKNGPSLSHGLAGFVGLCELAGAIGVVLPMAINVAPWLTPPPRAQAKKLVDEGSGEDLIRIPKRSSPSFVSAATYLDIIDTPQEYADFFGIRTPNPAVTRVRCPILAFFGGKDDNATQEALNLLKRSVHPLKSGPSRVDTSMIENGDHKYIGEEAQVAQKIAAWAATI